MAMSVFVALGASPDDIPHIASLQYQACATDPAFTVIHPGKPTAASLAHLTNQFENLMYEDPTAHFMIAKETTRGEIVSYAIWHFIPPRPAENVEEEMLAEVDALAFPLGANVELGKHLLKNSVRKRNEIASECFGMGTPYAYLDAIGTNPKYQRQGAASKLLEWAVERADDKNLPMYVESTSVACGLYQKFGFCKYDHLELDLRPGEKGDFTNTCMVRFPNAA